MSPTPLGIVASGRRASGGSSFGTLDEEILADAPSAYWKMEEASGSGAGSMLDSSGNGRHATYPASVLHTGSPLYPGSLRSALFPSEVGSHSSQTWMDASATGLTIEAHINLGNVNDVRGLLSRYSGVNGDWILWQRRGKIGFLYQQGGQQEIDGSVLFVGRVSHVIARVTATGIALFVDGRKVAQKLFAVTLPAATSNALQFGGYASANVAGCGLAAVAIYQTALSDARILTHARAASAPRALDAYVDAVCADEPQQYWSFDGGFDVLYGKTRQSLLESSANISLAPSVLRSAQGRSYLFNSALPAFITPTGAEIAENFTIPASTWAVEAWFKTETATTGALWNRTSNLAGDRSQIYLSGGAVVGYFHDTGQTLTSPLTTYADGVRHQAVIERDATHIRLYVDGVQVASATSTPPGAATGQVIYLGRGRYVGTATYFNGQGDEVSTYGAPLGATRVLAHYTAGITPPTQSGFDPVSATRTTAVANAGTAWTAFASDGSWDLLVPAAVGDIVEVGASLSWSPGSAGYCWADMAVIRDNFPIRWVSTGLRLNLTSGGGVFAWFAPNTFETNESAGSMPYTVQPGDVVGGFVRFRLYGKVSTGTRTLNVGWPQTIWAAPCPTVPTESALTGSCSDAGNWLTGSVTIDAVAGDWIAVSPNGVINPGSVGSEAQFSAATVVGGSAVNWLETGTGTRQSGVPGWGSTLNNYEPVGGTILYQVQSADVVAGKVTIKVWGVSFFAANRPLDTGSRLCVRKAGVSALSRKSGAVAVGTSVAALWADGSHDVVIAAAAGDVLEVGISQKSSSTNGAYQFLDAATVVSGAPVTYLSSDTGTPNTAGISAWSTSDVSSSRLVTGSVLYTVKSGDISGGQVRLRLYGRATIARTLHPSSSPAHFWATHRAA